jgi:hypothetical protein
MPPRMLRRFYTAGASWIAVLLIAIGCGGFVAHEFLYHTRPPQFVELEQLIGAPVGSFVAPEIIEETEARIGARPATEPGSGAAPMVQRAFRPGNVGKDGLRFTEWGPPVPYAYEGAVYWAVPFRYEAKFGFGQYRADTATALIRNGHVARFLFVPFWNFMGAQGGHS